MEIETSENFESKRIECLESFEVINSYREESFDRLAMLSALICDTPIALISFVDSQKQWVKSSFGIDLHELPRCLSACSKTILQDDYFEIGEKTLAADFPFVIYMKKNGFKFYGGVPLTSKDGFNIGTLCVIDYVHKKLSIEQIGSLKLISNQIMYLLGIRNNYRENLRRLKELGDSSEHSDQLLEDIAHKASMRAVAELSTGLSYRIKGHMLISENVLDRLSSSALMADDDYRSELEILKGSISSIKNISISLDKFILAEKEKWMKPISINVVVTDIVNHLEYRFREHHIECIIEADDELICVGNVAQVSDVIYALINNSIEALITNETKNMTIKLQKSGHDGFIDIIDSGAGVSIKIKPYIFQPFFSTKTLIGVGTGLSLARSIMHRHSGDIYLLKDSNPTIFRIYFPVP